MGSHGSGGRLGTSAGPVGPGQAGQGAQGQGQGQGAQGQQSAPGRVATFASLFQNQSLPLQPLPQSQHRNSLAVVGNSSLGGISEFMAKRPSLQDPLVAEVSAKSPFIQHQCKWDLGIFTSMSMEVLASCKKSTSR